MNILHDLFQYDQWATGQLVDFCQKQPAALLQENVAGTDRSILRTLTHLIGSQQEYLGVLKGEQADQAVQPGQVLSLEEIRGASHRLGQEWEDLLDRIDGIDVTVPADDKWPEIPHGQNVLVLQTLQHSIDHRTQICTTFALLSRQPPGIDGWAYWRAQHTSVS